MKTNEIKSIETWCGFGKMHSVEKSTHGVFGLLPKKHPKRDKIREFLAVLVLEPVESWEK